MNPLADFPWPQSHGHDAAPQWDGQHFKVGESRCRVLAYDTDYSHWNDSLTSLHETEAGRDHPIDKASRQLAVSSMMLLEKADPLILDVGCSSGFVLEDLRQSIPKASLIGADYIRGPLEGLASRMPEMPILQFDLRKCPLPDSCVDGITCLNVLEHIDDHEAALGEIFRLLKPGGVAHIEVPADPTLYDIYDEHLMHHRRYRLKELLKMAQGKGFQVEKGTHLGFTVFPAFWIVKRRNRRKLDLPPENKAIIVAAQIRSTRTNPLFAILTQLELLIGRYLSFPRGIRCVCVLRKL